MNSHKNILRIATVSLLLSGCASFVDHEEIPLSELEDAPEVLQARVAKTDSEIEKSPLAPQPTSKSGESELAQHPKLLVQMNRQVEFWIRHFTSRGKRSLEESLRRGQPYRRAIEKTLRDSGIPSEFYFLSLIESSFATHAVSHAGAVGFWQFMPGTGKRYGLECNRGFDERRDPLRATRAAATYLRDLYNVFGSWRLAMAAYNAGEYRILGAIMRGKTRDFWTLAEKHVLPKETMDYVPKFYAATILAKNPKKYGLAVPEDGDAYPDVAMIEVPSPVTLGAISKISGIDEGELKRLNPHLQRAVTPTWRSRYGIWIPAKHRETLQAKRTKLNALVLRAPKRPRVAAAVRGRSTPKKLHRVQRGETLTSIARRYGISIQWLKRTNALKSSRLTVGKQLVVVRQENRNHFRSRPGNT